MLTTISTTLHNYEFPSEHDVDNFDRGINSVHVYEFYPMGVGVNIVCSIILFIKYFCCYFRFMPFNIFNMIH